MDALQIFVFGKVQGVYYRLSTQRKASSLSLTGWVCNRMDGSVEIYAEGKKKDLQTLLSWCHKGPEMANVRCVEFKELKTSTPHSSFTIAPTR